MKARNSNVLMLFIFGMCCASLAADTSRQTRAKRVSKEEAWISKSDLIARVEVVSIENVHPVRLSGETDTAITLGYLLTLQISNPLLRRSTSAIKDCRIPMFRESLGKTGALLRVGGKGVICLQEVDQPELATSTLRTSPQLPLAQYYDFAKLPERLLHGDSSISAFLSESMTNEIERLSAAITVVRRSNIILKPVRASDSIPEVTIRYHMIGDKITTNVTYSGDSH